MAGELRQLTARDRWLLDLLAEHQVLTTEQIAGLGFDHTHTARNRLTVLHRRGILARFRDNVRPGSQAYRWCLGWIGAAYLANRDGHPVPREATTKEKTNRLSTSPRLNHLLGINAFFINLATHARHTEGVSLDVWWSEAACRRNATGDLARPDGHGQWTEGGHQRGFWLEYDTGTEPAHRLLAKLDGYTRLHRATRRDHAVCFRMQTTRQETELHKKLAQHPAVTAGNLTVATTAGTDIPAAGHVWLVPGHPVRYRLAHLPLAEQPFGDTVPVPRSTP